MEAVSTAINIISMYVYICRRSLPLYIYIYMEAVSTAILQKIGLPDPEVGILRNRCKARVRWLQLLSGVYR